MAMLSAVSAVTSILSGAIGAVGAIAQSNAVQAQANYEQKVKNRNAGIARAQAQGEAVSSWRETRRKLATIRTEYGASGLDLAGSPLDVLEDSATEGAFDVAKIRYAGEMRAQGFSEEAALAGMRSKSAKTAGYLSAAGELLGGFNDAGKTLMTQV